MNNEKKHNQNKKRSFLGLLLIKLFAGKEKLSLLEEEQMQSPLRTVVKNFLSNKLAMGGLLTFIIIFAVVIIGPFFNPLDLSFSETSQQNIGPGYDLMKYPKELEGKLKEISVGSTFSVGIDEEGKVHVWGKPKYSKTIDMTKIPSGMGKVVKIAAGYDHVIAINDMGKVFGWGSNRLQQSRIPDELISKDNIIDVVAGYQSSVVVTSDGYTYFFGNDSINDYSHNHEHQGQIAKVAVSSDAVLGLTLDNEVVYLGKQKGSYTKIPENMGKVVDLSATAATIAALNDKGQVYIWGNISEKGEDSIPKTDSKIVELNAGRFHYTAKTEDGKIYSWGDNHYGQSAVPKSLKDKNVKALYSGFYQNYAITEDNNIVTWGLKGYLLGSDDLGRDIFNRLLNGGKMSMTIGAIAVIISTIVGVIIGSISGFFGGKVDIILQRIVEIISSLPFLPFAMILSALIGNNMTSNQRIMLIMVILGLLQWPGLSRLIRAQVLAEREKEFVTAARAIGVKQMSIVFKHVLPNVISIIIVSATLDFATCMLIEATLSYLGFGVQAPQPTWGNMLFGSKNSTVIQNYWWRWVFASIILGICVICINLTGDGLRDAIDPKSQER
ncbi:MAG TPA: ABC transporter permease subunit [Clostridiales bacterium]|nr:ABC transporter permease subunit [Clostridiales bacterium]